MATSAGWLVLAGLGVAGLLLYEREKKATEGANPPAPAPGGPQGTSQTPPAQGIPPTQAQGPQGTAVQNPKGSAFRAGNWYAFLVNTPTTEMDLAVLSGLPFWQHFHDFSLRQTSAFPDPRTGQTPVAVIAAQSNDDFSASTPPQVASVRDITSEPTRGTLFHL